MKPVKKTRIAGFLPNLGQFSLKISDFIKTKKKVSINSKERARSYFLRNKMNKVHNNLHGDVIIQWISVVKDILHVSLCCNN